MKSMELREESDDLHLDLALSIGGAFRNLPEKSNGSDEESRVTDGQNRGEIRRRQGKRKREEDMNNPPLKKEKNIEGNLTNNVDLDKPDPALQIPYPYSSLQYVPFLNGYGYAFPCFVPYWAAGESPVGCQSVSDVGILNKKSGSCGSSPVCSSSIITDNHQSSSSLEGVSSNSCNSSISMNHVKPKPSNEKFVEESSHCKKKSSSSSSMENGKPPKPQIQSHNLPSFEQMPCVSTTGIGPNGSKITTNGFLYRYSNLEVSILCVCHGQSFSPAEFVKHGGGGDVSHPLKHITVLPPNAILPSSIR